MCFIDSVELDELHFPLVVKERRLVQDTEGAGRMVGAPAGYCEYGPVAGASLDVVYTADGLRNSASGTRGGLPGAPIRNYLRGADGELKELPGIAAIQLRPGETVVSYCAGGGGYGPPNERPVHKVKDDVEEGWITRQRAHDVYGVVFTDDGDADMQATAARRAALAAAATA